MSKIYRDWAVQKRIKQWARRHGLSCVTMNPPNESAFIRVWFSKEDAGQMKLHDAAIQRYGHTRGGHTG